MSDDDRALLRQETGVFRAGERRRRFDPVLCIGALGDERSARVVVPESALGHVDRQVRVDLLSAALEVAPEGSHTFWLRRAGQATRTADDAAWLVAAELAFAVAAIPLAGCYVVTREGWVDLRTGERKVWKRLRLTR